MSTTTDPVGARLKVLRGTLPAARLNARSVAAFTENPGCSRRRLIDAAGVRAFDLAAKLGHPPTRGQSPFAITAGKQFERRLKEGSGYALLVEALAPFVSLPAKPRVADLGTARGLPPGEPALRVRAAETETVLAAIARGDGEAPDLVDHPVLIFEIGGTAVFLEPDALAFRIGRRLELVEIKSYAVIDGQGDPGKLAATAGQAAVYLLALRGTLRRLGFDPEILSPSVILVVPRNFGRTPEAHRMPLTKKVAALERVLRVIPTTGSVLAELGLPATFTFDTAGYGHAGEGGPGLERAMRSLPMRYVPECLSSCDLARYCRHQAVVDDDPSRLGRTVRDSLAGISRLGDVLRLAEGGPRRGEEHLRDASEILQNARLALERARTRMVPPSPHPTSRTKRSSRRRAPR